MLIWMGVLLLVQGSVSQWSGGTGVVVLGQRRDLGVLAAGQQVQVGVTGVEPVRCAVRDRGITGLRLHPAERGAQWDRRSGLEAVEHRGGHVGYGCRQLRSAGSVAPASWATGVGRGCAVAVQCGEKGRLRCPLFEGLADRISE